MLVDFNLPLDDDFRLKLIEEAHAWVQQQRKERGLPPFDFSKLNRKVVLRGSYKRRKKAMVKGVGK